MTLQRKMAALIAGIGIAAAVGTPTASAQTASQLEQAELAGLSPQLRAQVLARAVNGNSVTEVLQVMLLNNIKIKHEASPIVALDWTQGDRGRPAAERRHGGRPFRPDDFTDHELTVRPED
jgi:hypothetical protein